MQSTGHTPEHASPLHAGGENQMRIPEGKPKEILYRRGDTEILACSFINRRNMKKDKIYLGSDYPTYNAEELKESLKGAYNFIFELIGMLPYNEEITAGKLSDTVSVMSYLIEQTEFIDKKN